MNKDELLKEFAKSQEGKPKTELQLQVEQLAASRAEIEQQAQSKQAEQDIKNRFTDTSKQMLLPIAYGDSVRPVPNSILRSALFGAIKRGKRPYLDNVNIPAQNGIDITYTGGRLDQADLDLWEAILFMCKEAPLETEFKFPAYAILKHLGKPAGGKERKWLKSALNRLSATTLELSYNGGRYSYSGSLVGEVLRDHQTKEYIVTISKHITKLFEKNSFTFVDWEIRRELGNKQLAKWLHGFYSSHKKAYPLKVETIMELSGSTSSDKSGFKRDLRKSFNALTIECQKKQVEFNYKIEGELVWCDVGRPKRIPKK